MQFVANHYRNYSKYVRKSINNRRQQWDRRSQLHSITENPKIGEKLPCYVKFPILSKVIEEDLPRDHFWAQHRSGKHNGLYFLTSEERNTNECVPGLEYGNRDIVDDFLDHDLYNILDLGFRSMYQKLETQNRPGLIQLSRPDLDISTENGEEVLELSKLFSISIILHLSHSHLFSYINTNSFQ